MPSFTEEEYAITKSVDLVQLAEELGYQTKRVGGKHSLVEMDSVIIFGRASWYRYSAKVCVFEAEIDMMSYIDYTGDYESNNLVLGMVSDGPLEQMLKDYPHIRHIHFCLDNDKAGRKAMYKLIRKYAAFGYAVSYELPLLGKDHNECLKGYTYWMKHKRE